MTKGTLSRAAVMRWIVGVSALAGFCLGAILLLVGVLGMVPAWDRGQTGMFGIGFGVAIQSVAYLGAGVSLGVFIGLVVAGTWWIARGRLMPRSPRTAESATPYPLPPV